MAEIKRKLSEILKETANVDIDFIDLQQDEAVDGSQIIRLVLAQPIPVVFGRTITDRVSGDSITLEAADVERISIGAEAIAEIEKLEDEGKNVFTWLVEGKKGNLKCPLKMDVSNAGEVWVVKTSFAAFGNAKRRERQATQAAGLKAKINDNKAKRVLGQVDVTKVASGAEAVES